MNSFDVYNIHREVVFVTDRGPNIRAALRDYQQVNCIAHIINNIVREMCGKVEIVKELVSEVASFVRYMKKSSLNTLLKPSLVSMCDTRWNTVFDMFYSFVNNYESVINVLILKDKITKLGNISKNRMKEISDFLEYFKRVSTRIQSDKELMIDQAWAIMSDIKSYLSQNEHDPDTIRNMKTVGNDYISANNLRNNEKILEPHMIHKIAVFLQPEMKSLRKLNNEQKQEVYNYVRSLIDVDISCSATQVTDNSSTQNNTTRNPPSNSISIRRMSFFDEESIFHGDEVDSYIHLSIIPSGACYDFELIQWWNANKITFPNLYKLFFRIHSITLTSAAAERCFSRCGHLLNDLRSNMNSDFVNDLVIVEDLKKNKM